MQKNFKRHRRARSTGDSRGRHDGSHETADDSQHFGGSEAQSGGPECRAVRTE